MMTAAQLDTAVRLFIVIGGAALILGLFTRRIGGEGGGSEAGIVPALVLSAALVLGVYMAYR